MSTSPKLKVLIDLSRRDVLPVLTVFSQETSWIRTTSATSHLLQRRRDKRDLLELKMKIRSIMINLSKRDL